MSFTKTRLGVAIVLSKVKANALLFKPTFPAASICRTMTDLLPSPISVKAIPLPVVQFTLLSVLYCHVAFDAKPETFTTPLLVMVSLALMPVSADNESDGTGIFSVNLTTAGVIAVVLGSLI